MLRCMRNLSTLYGTRNFARLMWVTYGQPAIPEIDYTVGFLEAIASIRRYNVAYNAIPDPGNNLPI